MSQLCAKPRRVFLFPSSSNLIDMPLAKDSRRSGLQPDILMNDEAWRVTHLRFTHLHSTALAPGASVRQVQVSGTLRSKPALLQIPAADTVGRFICRPLIAFQNQ
jgi:hypothetical protein